MKKIILLLMAILVPITLFSAGRAPGSFSIGAFGGVGLPQNPSDFKDMFKNSIGFGGELKYNINEMTGLAVSYLYMPFKLDVDYMKKSMDLPSDVSIDLEGGSLKINPISINLIRYFTKPEAGMGFYATVGGAYYMIGFSDLTVSGTEPISGLTISQTVKGDDMKKDSGLDNKFGINGGVGLEFKTGSKLSVFAEGKYHYIFTDANSTQDGESKSGEKTTFISILGGVRLGLGGN